MKEFLEGRRLGFAPRPALGSVALGLGVGALILDLAAWLGWGGGETNGFAIAAFWLAIAIAVVSLLALLTAVAEYLDVPDAERTLARLDLAAIVFAIALYGASALVRATDLGAAAAGPAALLLGVGGLIVLLADAGLAGNLYAPREWEEIEEEDLRRERHPRRRAAAR